MKPYRLGKIGDVYPIGASTGTVTVDGKPWDLWIGMNGGMKVFSFVAPTVRNDFHADVKKFYNHLEKNQGFPASSQHLIGELSTHIHSPARRDRPVEENAAHFANINGLVFQFGTEAFTGGPATMLVSNWSAKI